MASIYPGFLRKFFLAVCSGFLLSLMIPIPFFSEANAQQYVTKPGTKPDALSKAQQEQIRALISSFLLENPEIVGAAIVELQKRERERAKASRAQAMKNLHKNLARRTDIPKIGAANASNVIIEFFDYNCPHCRRSMAAVDHLERNDPSVAIWFVELPILAETSPLASRAALAAGLQGKYIEMHRYLMGARGPITDQAIADAARSIGLDTKRLHRDMNGKPISESIRKNKEIANNLQIRSVPSWVIGNELIPGALSAAELQNRIAHARASAK